MSPPRVHGWIMVKVSTQVHHLLQSVQKQETSVYTSFWVIYLFLFAYRTAEREVEDTVRLVRAEFYQTRADQFKFVSACPQVVVSMYSCHWKSAWNPLRQKPALISSPPVHLSCTPCSYLLTLPHHISSPSSPPPSVSNFGWQWWRWKDGVS